VNRAHQRKIRDEFVANDPRPELALSDCTVELVERGSPEWEKGSQVILRYEWLGNTGAPQFMATMKHGDEIVGACCFGNPGSREANNVIGQEWEDVTICLERGACVHWTPKNAPSFMISRAVKEMKQAHNFSMFYGYADESAGEIGQIYQALNWIYLGKGLGHAAARWYFRDPKTGVWVGSRSFYRRGLKKSAALEAGWEFKTVPTKHKYVWVEGGPALRRMVREIIVEKYGKNDYPKMNGRNYD